MLKKGMILLIRGYQSIVSPLLLPSCRFYPSCSSFAIQSIEKFGFWKGTFLFILRIFKCHPLHPGGYDPVK